MLPVCKHKINRSPKTIERDEQRGGIPFVRYLTASSDVVGFARVTGDGGVVVGGDFAEVAEGT